MGYSFEKTFWNVLGMDTYKYLIDNKDYLLSGTENSAKEYKHKFITFYKVRRNKKTWIDPFFEIFKEALKDKEPDFNKYFEKIKKECKHNNKSQNELSFTSKMLHTINPEKFPILDSRVLSSLKIKNDENAYSNLYNKINNELLKDNNFLTLMDKIKNEIFLKLNEKTTNYKLVDIILYSNPNNI